MEINLESPRGKYQIRSYQPGKLVINDKTYTHSVIITVDQLISWRPQSFNDLQIDDLTKIFELKPDVVLLGTGEKQNFLSQPLTSEFTKKNISIEVMNTHAACRTFNILLGENRKVVAGLIIN